jgi:uncharacterized protein (TIGR02466 family)
MNIEHIFTTPLVSDHLLLDNVALEKFCKESVDNFFADKQASPVYTKQTQLIDPNHPVMQPLLHAVHDRANEFYQTLGMKKNTKLNIIRVWAQTGNSLHIDVPHTHPIGFLSAVYYVKGTGTKENGILNIMSPVAALAHTMNSELIEIDNGFNAVRREVYPETGKLIMFPSWIMHSVSTNHLVEERISIAIDLSIFEKE